MSKFADLAALLEQAAKALREADLALCGVKSPVRTPIAAMNFSVRARKGLFKNKIEYIEDLADKTVVELLEWPHFGMTSVREVRSKLKEQGLHLRGDTLS